MWTDNRTLQESLYILESISRLLATGPQSNHFYELVVARDFLTLIKSQVEYPEDPDCDADQLEDIKNARQIQALYSKNASLELGLDKDACTLDKFLEAEEKCLWTNRKFQYLRRKPNYYGPAFAAAIHAAQRKISKVLGDLPPPAQLSPTFGPGANTTVKGSSSSARLKLGSRLACSNELAPYLGIHLEDVPVWTSVHDERSKILIDSVPYWSEFHSSLGSWIVSVDVTPGRLQFVPKTALVHRPIIVEPLLNSFFQKGVGSYIRDRLMDNGVDLSDQTFNQRLACYGSVTGEISTIDLSSASDMISREIVYELLPLEWAEYLSTLCTRNVEFRGSQFSLEKFSSMGNGFTFELESLLFWALAKAACSVRKVDSTLVNVFGDDIIVPKRADSFLRELLEFCGFEVNHAKSYNSSCFRESCGADFYNGIDIRPFYQKTLVSDRTLYTMHNWLVRHHRPDIAEHVASFVNQDEVLWGPDGYGDGHLITNDYSLRRSRRINRDKWGGGTFDTYTLRPCRNKKASKGDPAFPTYSVYTRSGKLDATDPNVVRGSRGYAKVSIYMLPSYLK